MKTMVHLGSHASFSGQAARNWGGDQLRYEGVSSFSDLFRALKSGNAELALLPVENSLAGVVDENLDLLSSNDLWIAAETHLSVVLCLGICEPIEVAALTHVVSHPKALAQCANFFEKNAHLVKVVANDTASAVAGVAQEGNPSWAAIASPIAMRDYGLSVHPEQVADSPVNVTRFFVLTRKPQGNVAGSKASIVMTLEHKPGALAAVLSRLTALNINLTSIESRPIKSSPFEYLFYLDLTLPGKIFGVDEMKNILHCTKTCKILGLYDESTRA